MGELARQTTNNFWHTKMFCVDFVVQVDVAPFSWLHATTRIEFQVETETEPREFVRWKVKSWYGNGNGIESGNGNGNGNRGTAVKCLKYEIVAKKPNCNSTCSLPLRCCLLQSPWKSKYKFFFWVFGRNKNRNQKTLLPLSLWLLTNSFSRSQEKLFKV